jgi:hypothetical protein
MKGSLDLRDSRPLRQRRTAGSMSSGAILSRSGLAVFGDAVECPPDFMVAESRTTDTSGHTRPLPSQSGEHSSVCRCDTCRPELEDWRSRSYVDCLDYKVVI